MALHLRCRRPALGPKRVVAGSFAKRAVELSDLPDIIAELQHLSER
jgi:hypothetical protein